MTPTLDRVLRSAAARLGEAGVASPVVDAEVLLAHVLAVDLSDLRRSRVMGEVLPEGAETAYQELVARRATRVPLQHLTGTASFAGLDLQVGPGVFVPRPETELLVELAVAALVGLDAPTVVDLCTGSGAVALGVARRRPDARVGAVELSPQAHGYAAANVSRSGLAVDLRLGRAQEAFGDWLEQVDVVTSNPPYIPPGMVPVDVEVREHDPELALFGGGEDGLDVPREVAARAAELLRPGGVLLMEHADVQGVTLPATLMATGAWAGAEDHRDLAGLPRVTRAVRAR